MLQTNETSKYTQKAVGHAQDPGPVRAADRVKKVDEFFICHGRRHGDLGDIQIGEGSANAAGSRDHTGDAEADAVGALIADNLQRQARRGFAFDGGRAVRVHQSRRERGEKTAHGGTKADADEIDFHRLAFHGGGSGGLGHVLPQAG